MKEVSRRQTFLQGETGESQEIDALIHPFLGYELLSPLSVQTISSKRGFHGFGETAFLVCVVKITDINQKTTISTRNEKKMANLEGINISHLGKRKIIFKIPFLGDMLVPWRVTVPIDWFIFGPFTHLPKLVSAIDIYFGLKVPGHTSQHTFL